MALDTPTIEETGTATMEPDPNPTTGLSTTVPQVRRLRDPETKRTNPITMSHGGRSSAVRDFDKHQGAWSPNNPFPECTYCAQRMALCGLTRRQPSR